MSIDLVPKALEELMNERRRAAKEWKPHAYQERALKFMLENGQGGLLLSPGMGKTSVSLAAIKILTQRKFVKRALVIAPLRPCYDVWPMEVCDWTEFADLHIALLHGADKEKNLRQLTPAHKICIINPEGLAWLTSSAKRIAMLDADMLIVDESSLFKSSQAVRFKALRSILRTFKRRYILTGSPRPRHYLDLFAQIFLLDMGVTLGAYVSHYRNQYFYPTGFEMREWELLPGADKQIDAAIAPMVMRLDAKDYLRLPRELERTHRVELPPKARKEYDTIEQGLLSTLFSQPLVNSASARSKLCQIANGSVYTDPIPDEKWGRQQRKIKVIHTAKVEALVDLVNELQGEPLLVGIGFLHDVIAIRKALGKDIPCINGETTRAQSAEYIDKWNKGLLPLLLAHPASAGHGLNMQKFNAQNVCFFDLPDNFDTYYQFFLRVCRQGNKSAFVMKHHLVVTNTVDVVKLRMLKNKDTGQRAFLDSMKKYSEERRSKK